MSDPVPVTAVVGGTIDTFVVCAGAGLPVAQKTVAQVRTLLNVANGATANSSDAVLLARSNHTGTQTASTISDFASAVSGNAAVAANTAKVSNATHSGDATGATVLTLANTGVAAGSYTNASLTVDAKGRLTAASSGAAATPGGSSGQMQINNAGSFGGAAAVLYSSSGSHVTITSQGSSIVGLTVIAPASPSANSTEWKTNGGTVGAAVGYSGVITTNTGLIVKNTGYPVLDCYTQFPVLIRPASAGWQALIVKSQSGQTANPIESQSSAGVVEFSVAPGGSTLADKTGVKAYTAGTLPSAAAWDGYTSRVTDSSVAAVGNYGATVAGGGANKVKVWSNGTNWIIA